jgi:hypothetical protein
MYSMILPLGTCLKLSNYKSGCKVALFQFHLHIYILWQHQHLIGITRIRYEQALIIVAMFTHRSVTLDVCLSDVVTMPK